LGEDIKSVGGILSTHMFVTRMVEKMKFQLQTKTQLKSIAAKFKNRSESSASTLGSTRASCREGRESSTGRASLVRFGGEEVVGSDAQPERSSRSEMKLLQRGPSSRCFARSSTSMRMSISSGRTTLSRGGSVQALTDAANPRPSAVTRARGLRRSVSGDPMMRVAAALCGGSSPKPVETNAREPDHESRASIVSEGCGCGSSGGGSSSGGGGSSSGGGGDSATGGLVAGGSSGSALSEKAVSTHTRSSDKSSASDDGRAPEPGSPVRAERKSSIPTAMVGIFARTAAEATSTLTSSLFDSSKAKGTATKKAQEPDKALAYHYGVFGSLIDDEINEGRNRTLPGTGADCVDKSTSRDGAESLSALLMKPKAGKSKGVDSRSTMLQELTHTLKKKKEEEEAMVRELTRAESGPHGVLLEELRAVKAAQADSVGAVQQAIRELKAEQAAWQEQHAERIEGALLRAIGLLEAHASAAAASEPQRRHHHRCGRCGRCGRFECSVGRHGAGRRGGNAASRGRAGG